jgi:hypothetical protein
MQQGANPFATSQPLTWELRLLVLKKAHFVVVWMRWRLFISRMLSSYVDIH